MEPFIARSPVDLLAVVPYVIGFHPEDSVVMLTFATIPAGTGGKPGAESFHARVDLPLVEQEQRDVAAMLREVAGRHGATVIGLVLYTHDVAAAQGFADLLVPGLVSDGIEVIDVIRVDADRFYPVDDPDDDGIPYDLGSHLLTATAVLQGRVLHESRGALLDSLVGTDEDDARAVEEAATEVVDDLLETGRTGKGLGIELEIQARWLQARIRDLLSEPGAVPPADAARLLVLVSFEALREVAWAEMTRASAPGHVELWRGLLRRAPADLRSGVGGLLGFAAWLAGDGALAWCALERCFGSDPDDQLGQHVASLVESATPPSVWSPVPVESLRIFRMAAEESAAS